MTTSSNFESNDLDPENQRPRDWRRRRRSERTSSQIEMGKQSRPQSSEDGEELSQPLISFFEPALNLIALYSGPLIIAGVVALITGIAVVAFIGSMRLYGYIDIVIGLVLLGGVGSVLFSNVLTAFLSRTGRYGTNTLILVGAFTGIIVVANVISFENSGRLDVTATNQFSLGNRTKDVLSNLSEDVRATAFYKDEEDTDRPEVAARRNKVLNTLEEFDSRTSKFTYRVIDPDLKPEIVSKFFGARPTGFVTETIVVEGMDSGEFDVLQPTDASFTELEQDLVTSTLVATGKEKKLIYFLSGHGERDINGPLSDGYAAVRSGLEGDNYRVEEL
ncbi:MAG: Gldg family protein, partial [Chloroflexota bacterium]|nr:Gldg family protein [Chloroflexota bacterium]